MLLELQLVDHLIEYKNMESEQTSQCICILAAYADVQPCMRCTTWLDIYSMPILF